MTIEQMTTWLSNFGTILSSIAEDCFNDTDADEGVNGMGTYNVKMKLFNKIPSSYQCMEKE
jgi:hypothetical protein